jgi:hypothetical protein
MLRDPTNAIPKILRYVAALFVLTSGMVHLLLWLQSYRIVPIIGPLFATNFFAAFVIGLGLIIWPKGGFAVLGLAFSLGTLTAFVVAATDGLFNFKASWSPYALVAAISEVSAAISLLAWLALSRPKRRSAVLGDRIVFPDQQGSNSMRRSA